MICLKTLTKKAMEVANKFDLKINVLVYDPAYHRLKEHYTDPIIKLE